MTDAKAEVSKILHESRNAIEEAHRKLSSVAGVDKERLSRAMEKFKSAHRTFEDDAQEMVTH